MVTGIYHMWLSLLTIIFRHHYLKQPCLSELKQVCKILSTVRDGIKMEDWTAVCWSNKNSQGLLLEHLLLEPLNQKLHLESNWFVQKLVQCKVCEWQQNLFFFRRDMEYRSQQRFPRIWFYCKTRPREKNVTVCCVVLRMRPHTIFLFLNKHKYLDQKLKLKQI